MADKTTKRTTRGRAAKRSSRPATKNSKSLGTVLKKFKFQQKIAKSQLRPGMIINFKYNSKYSNDPSPLVLVLNARFLGKLHGINLNYCSYGQVIKISKVVNQKIDQQAVRLKQRYKMTSPHGFYHKQLKPVLRGLKKSVYRTYFYSGVKQPTLMDFKFNQTKGKKQLVIRSVQGSVQSIVQKLNIKTTKDLPTRKSKDVVKTVNINSKSKSVKPQVLTNIKQVQRNVKQVKNVKTINRNIVDNVVKSLSKEIDKT